jgi:RsmE family RNA methyltransferase
VGQIILTNAWKVERNYFDTHVLDEAVYRPLLIEGLQQAGDTHLPAVGIHRRFKVLIEDHLDSLFPEGRRIVAHPGNGQPILKAIERMGKTRVLLAVGPEGGWTDYEIDLLKRHRFRTAGMGPRTIRSDTACIALLSLVHESLR